MSETTYKQRWVSIDIPEEKFGPEVVANHWAARCAMRNFGCDVFSALHGFDTRRVTYISARNEGETDKEYVARLKDGLALKVADMIRNSNPIA